MVKRAMLSVHKVNLSKISGDGEFPCPKCGSAISPDDETEDTYTIVDTVVDYNDSLESLVIKCKKCKTKINLEGFDSLTEEDNKKMCDIAEKWNYKKGKKMYFFSKELK